MTRKTAVIAMVTAGMTLASWAYGQAGPATGPAHGGRFVERLTEKLNLTPDQQAQVQSILQQARTDAANATDPQARHEVFKAAFTKIKTDVLNDQQRAEWQQMKKDWRGHGHHRMMGYRALNLTEDQRAQVKAVMQQAKADAQNAADPQARHAIWKTAKEKINTTVLTQDQRDQLAQMRAACKGRHHGAASQPAAE